MLRIPIGVEKNLIFYKTIGCKKIQSNILLQQHKTIKYKLQKRILKYKCKCLNVQNNKSVCRIMHNLMLAHCNRIQFGTNHFSSGQIHNDRITECIFTANISFASPVNYFQKCYLQITSAYVTFIKLPNVLHISCFNNICYL